MLIIIIFSYQMFLFIDLPQIYYLFLKNAIYCDPNFVNLKKIFAQCQLPAMTMQARPPMNKRNINPSSQSTAREAPLNSFHTQRPQSAATIGAPWPSA